MSAREMFEKLGYQLDTNNELLLIYRTTMVEIVFQKDYKKYHALWGTTPLSFNVDLHKAIHQQCMELGWIDPQ